MYGRRMVYNSVSTILLQITSLVFGLVVPKFLISTYGSEVNGMIHSITQFLSCVALMEAGIGGVLRAALYKPLAKQDNYEIGAILNTANKFFKKIALIFSVYLIILALVYPFIIIKSYDYFYTFSLVIIIGISTVAQYYFGITYQILLTADGKAYFTTVCQIIAIILNGLSTIILIKLGSSIHIVKLISALIFIVRPITFNLYVRLKYPNIERNAELNNELLKQRWDGMAQHISSYVHDNTDVVVLTLFKGMKAVSIYAVYNMVINGLKNLSSSLAAAFSPEIGRLIALDDKKKLNTAVNMYELLGFIICNIVFTVCAFMFIPFIKIYTAGIKDANYIDYKFGLLISLSGAVTIIRNIYQNIVLAAGHYKRTNTSAYTEAILNIVISLLFVHRLGLCGIMIGTLISMIYRIMYYIFYLKENILYRDVKHFVKRFAVNSIPVVVNTALYFLVVKDKLICANYLQWVEIAFVLAVFVSIITIIPNFIFYKEDCKRILKKIVFFVKR